LHEKQIEGGQENMEIQAPTRSLATFAAGLTYDKIPAAAIVAEFARDCRYGQGEQQEPDDD